MKDGEWGLPLIGGLIIGAWAGSHFGRGYGNCGGYGGYGGYGGWGGNCGPVGPGYGYGPGYYTGDRPCHEDKQDDKIACLQAQIAAIGVSDRKNEKIAELEDKIVEGKIFRATCRKPDGEVYLSPRHLANGYVGETRAIDSHSLVRHDGFRDGFRDGCRDGFRRDGFNDGCCGGFDNWY